MKDLFFSIVNIFRHAGKVFTFVRNTTMNIILVGIICLLIFSLIPIKDLAIPQNSILKLQISGNIVEEKKPISALENFLDSSLGTQIEPETLLQDVLDTIDSAAKDENISLLLLDLKNLKHAGLNQLMAIGQAIENFRSPLKKVIAAADYYTQTQYYIASYADNIIINPMGIVDLHGFGVYRLYFKKALEKLQINYNIFKVGTYKSALEPFTRNNMSDQDRLQSEVWLSALWEIYTDDVNKQRNLDPEAITKYTTDIASQLEYTKGDSAKLALKLGLIDQIMNRQQLTAYLSIMSGSKNNSGPNIITSTEYTDRIDRTYDGNGSSSDKIGIIIAEGNIVPGKQPAGLIGDDSLGMLIQKARKDDAVKAVVLRINSGGGSAFASEIIRQELLALKKSGKPFVVSMGTVTASGGYWIAANSDEIWASPATITGSIGIFGALPTFEKTLASFGVYSDGVGTTPLASGINLTQPLPEQLRSAIQQGVAHGYDQFLSIVSEGRNLERSHVENIAEGRVYDGQTAKNLGLVDKLGTLEDAVKSAAELASLTDFQAEYIRRPETVRDHFLQYLTTRVSGELIKSSLKLTNPALTHLKNSAYSQLEKLLKMEDPRGIYAYSFIPLQF